MFAPTPLDEGLMPHHSLPRPGRLLLGPLLVLLLLTAPPAPAQDGPKKQPVPAAAARKAAEALVLEVFQEDIDNAKDAAARARLAAQLLQQGRELRDPKEA